MAANIRTAEPPLRRDERPPVTNDEAAIALFPALAAATSGSVLYEDFSLRTVAGVSLFWKTPIGPLRFNFSEALKKEPLDVDRSFDLTISTRF